MRGVWDRFLSRLAKACTQIGHLVIVYFISHVDTTLTPATLLFMCVYHIPSTPIYINTKF